MLTAYEKLSTGCRVFSSDGFPIGSVARVGSTHFRCDSGFLGMGRQLFIPYANVHHVDGESCYLDVSRHHIDRMNFYRVPAGWI